VTDRLERALGDVARRWVPDLRAGVWEVARATSRAGQPVLAGATTSRDGLVALRTMVVGHGLGCEVRLLPDESVSADESWAVVTAAVAPLLSQPALRAEPATQALHGEVLAVLERRGAWLRVRAPDEYHAWVHFGYLALGPAEWADDWSSRASGVSLGADVRVEPGRCRLPFGARVALRGDGRVELADGWLGHVTSGAVRPEMEFGSEARITAPGAWALRHFQGAPFLWGGRTTWGVDCSGLVQVTYAARGIGLPRDSDQQALAGQEVPLDPDGGGYAPGDLLFFAEDGKRISHVALWVGEGRVVHSSISRGGVGEDQLFGDEDVARRLLPALVGVRRVYST